MRLAFLPKKIRPFLVSAVCFCGAAFAQSGSSPQVDTASGQFSMELALSMDEAVALAMQRSFRVTRTARSAEMAQLRTEASEAFQKPRIDTYLGVNQSLRSAAFYRNPYGSGKSDAAATTQASLNAVLSVPIDVSGSIGRQREMGRLSLQMAASQVEQSAVDINADIRSTYADALRAQGAVDADEAVLAELRGLIERARQRRSSAVPFLEVELANAEQSLSVSRSSASIAQAGLRNQLRLPEGTVLRLTSTLDRNIPLVDADSLLETALAKRADVRDAKMRLQQAELSLVQSRDSRLPTAHLFGFMYQSYSGNNPGQLSTYSSRNASFMVNLNVPLIRWDGGGIDKMERIALLSLEQARDDMEEQRARIASELRLLTINLAQAQRRLASLPSTRFAMESLRQAEEAVLSHADWQGQMAQVSNARNSWRLAHTAAIDALADYYTAYYRLKRSLGEQ